MKNQKSKQQIRIFILLNFSSLIAGISLFYLVKILQWPISYLLLEIVILAIFIISLIKAFIVTNSWKMVHTSPKNLDEREMTIVLNAIRYAYSIFTILCLVIIYVFAIGKYFQPIDVVLASGLLYLAHMLPAAIIAWTEKVL